MTEPDDASNPSLSSLLTRHRLLMLVSITAGGLVTALVGLPLVAFLIAPLLRKEAPVWRDVGALNNFEVGHTSKVTFNDSLKPREVNDLLSFLHTRALTAATAEGDTEP